jgi:hypothetical protein
MWKTYWENISGEVIVDIETILKFILKYNMRM